MIELFEAILRPEPIIELLFTYDNLPNHVRVNGNYRYVRQGKPEFNENPKLPYYKIID